jgi:hypothetical protein
MFSAASAFIPLERAVLTALCEMYPADRANLERQLSTANFSARENTGAGFYTSFVVKREPCTAVGAERLRDGPQVSVDGLKYGMGFILWLEEGFANCLEGYSYGENTAAMDLEKLGFAITPFKK